MVAIYNIVVGISDWIIRLVSLFKSNESKLNKLIEGRTQSKFKLKGLGPKSGKRIWAHAASLGEFEMLRPLLEELQEDHWEIHVSFFSPSGYTHAKMPENWTQWYLLSDRSTHAKQWLNHLDPDLVIWAKYEFWLNHLKELNHRNIPFVYWNLLLRPNHFLSKPWAASWRKELSGARMLFCQDRSTLELASKWIHCPNEVSGDFRYLQALQLKTQTNPPKLNSDWLEYIKEKRVLIVGSAWQPELDSIKYLMEENNFTEAQHILIAPHDVSEKNLRLFESTLNGYGLQRLSAFSGKEQPRITLVDSIGLLSRIYQYGEISIVGGGFQNALHNIVEPMSYGLPVFTGNHTAKFPEAALAEKNQALKQYATTQGLATTISSLWSNPTELRQLKKSVTAFFASQVPNIEGASNFCRGLVTN